MLAIEAEGVRPDVLILGKALSGRLSFVSAEPEAPLKEPVAAAPPPDTANTCVSIKLSSAIIGFHLSWMEL